MVQAFAGQETDRADSAEAQVASLSQQVQSRSSEGRAWFAQLQQAQQDLLAAQVAFKHMPACCARLCLGAGAVSWGFRTCWMPRSGGCEQAQLVCAVMRCKQDFWFNYSGGSRARYVQYRTLSVIMQLYTCISKHYMPAQAAVQGCNGPSERNGVVTIPIGRFTFCTLWQTQYSGLRVCPCLTTSTFLFRSLLPPFGVYSPERAVIPLLMSEGIVPSVVSLQWHLSPIASEALVHAEECEHFHCNCAAELLIANNEVECK